ncbi:MAG TPA: glycosyltransferase family 4 protein [Rhizomicrobium sp.]|jgi:glycosyltransferase involved in cell wall biosynthesis|nr:glycosyltransferase family 4 protein [Rhizomicrobium sp.]
MTHSRTGAANGPAILQVVPRLDTGGAERATIDIAAALVAEGFESLVVADGGRMVAELVAAGGEWISMPLNTKSPIALVANVRRLRRLIRARGVKLVHARSRAPAWSVFFAARGERIPFVTTFHGAYSARSALKRFYNSVMLRGDAVIANSHWTADHIRTRYALAPKRLVVVHRGVDLDVFDPARVKTEDSDRLRRSWGVRDGETVILLPGRITRWKGQLVFVEALAQLLRNGAASFRAVLAGDSQGRDSYVAEVKRSIERNRLGSVVTMAGHVTDMAAVYRAADIVVSASTEPEAFGRVAAEASAMERPVIATDHGGSRETILPGISGILVPPGDAKALAAALAQLVQAGPEARSALGVSGRNHILRNFSLARMTTDTLSLYRDLLGGALLG